MPPNLTAEYLSQSSVSALRSILGKNVWLACSSSLEMSTIDNILVAPEIVLPVAENGFLVMANDGFYDSPIAHVSYYSIGIAWSRNPSNLEISYNGRAASFGAGVSHIAFPHLDRNPRLRITRIEIYEAVVNDANLHDEHETVRYDKAICLYREDGMRICFRLEDSIRAFFQVLLTDAQISVGLGELSIRATLEAQ